MGLNAGQQVTASPDLENPLQHQGAQRAFLGGIERIYLGILSACFAPLA
jgi:hypothetical protein